MSNTPETDKAERMAWGQEYMVETSFARKLEQERNTLSNRVQYLEDRLDLEIREGNIYTLKIERERDEALEKIKQQKLEIVRLNGATNHAGGTPLKIALRKCDEAREGLAEEIKFHHRTHSELVQTQCQMQDVIRERDEAREELRTAVQERHDFHWELLDAIRDRNEAREERDKLKQLLAADSENVDAYLGVLFQRDEAREEIKRQAERIRELEGATNHAGGMEKCESLSCSSV